MALLRSSGEGGGDREFIWAIHTSVISADGGDVTPGTGLTRNGADLNGAKWRRESWGVAEGEREGEGAAVN